LEVGVMPKEVIANKYDDPNSSLFRAEVRWNRNMYVQVATTWEAIGPGHHRASCVAATKGGPAGIGRALDTPAAACGGEHCPPDGIFVDLDRDGINRLIRALRKARDQAFGADA
jgi:hypothetical protein